MNEEFRHLLPQPQSDDTVLPGHYVVAVIGIDDYTQWPKLHNAVSDARGVEKLFVEKYGFVNPIPPLLNEAATATAITELVQDQLPRYLMPNDSLVLFFAGHGHTHISQVDDRQVETGYIIPVGARTDSRGDYLKINSLLEDISLLPTRHILLILDACHSGFALSVPMTVQRSAIRYESDLGKRRSRKVITSARRDQTAVDSGPVAGHSLFTGMLVDGFNWGTVDLDGNGVVTSFELGLFLQQRVGQWSEAKQTPDFGSFQLDDRGEMVISLGDENFDAVKARAFTALRYRDLANFRQLVAQACALRPQSPEAIYLQYQLHLLKGRIEQAIQNLHRLQSMQLAPGVIPLTRKNLADLTVQLTYWQSLLMVPTTDIPVEISLLTKSEADTWDEPDQIASALGQIFRLNDGSIMRFRARNLTDAPAHLYFVSQAHSGTILSGPLLEDDDVRIDGLAAGAEGLSPLLMMMGPPGIYEIRIFYSPARISPLLFPPTVASRAAFVPFKSDHVLMKRVLYEVTAAEIVPSTTDFQQ